MIENEKWQVEVGGNIYDCEFPELKQWIAERALLPQDKVRRGNRAWIEAGRVPVLRNFFDGQDFLSIQSSSLAPANPILEVTNHAQSQNSLPPHSQVNKNISHHLGFCHFHPDVAAAFVCGSCHQSFCKLCPKAFGSVRVCPLCGELCKSVSELQIKSNKNIDRQLALQEGFGFKDFGQAWVYPFRFWQNLCLGALFVAVLFLGGFFGSLLANAVLFGCIAQTINFVANGDLEHDFMPDFTDFNIWDTVVRPFLLSLSVLVVAYLPVGLIMFGLFFSVLNSLENPMAVIKAQQENSAAAVKESVSTQILLNQQEAEKQQLNTALANASPQTTQIDENELQNLTKIRDTEAAALQKVEEIARNSSGNAPPAIQKTDAQIMYSILEPIFKSSPLIIFLLIIALLWAIFYLPMALTVAGYTGSLLSTLNPLVGIDTVRRMGAVYGAAFFFCLIVQCLNLVLAGFIGYATKSFDLPIIGNLPATFLIAMCSFYFSLVIAFVLGSALYKTSDRLGIRAI